MAQLPWYGTVIAWLNAPGPRLDSGEAVVRPTEVLAELVELLSNVNRLACARDSVNAASGSTTVAMQLRVRAAEILPTNGLTLTA